MLDFSAYLAAQQITRDAVNEALPDVPARPDRVPVARRPEIFNTRQRKWLSLPFLRLVQAIQPMPERAGSPLPAGR